MSVLWLNFGVALALGLLVGIERERSKGRGPGRGAAGIRSFAIASLLGAVAMQLGGMVLLSVATAGIALLAIVSYVRTHGDDPGVTTETALITMPLLGALALEQRALASALTVVLAVLLAAKRPVHGFVTRVITATELTDALLFAAAALIIWPQLPDRDLGPWHALNPHRLGLFAVLMLSVQAAGHVAVRLVGVRFGLAAAGLAGGFVSSIATIAAMGARAEREPGAVNAAAAGAAFSTVATFVQMGLLIAAVSLPVFGALVFVLMAGGIAAAACGMLLALSASDTVAAGVPRSDRILSVKTVIVLTGTVAVILMLAAGLDARWGELGVIVGGGVAGLVDAHAAAVSIASLAASGRLAASGALTPILVVLSANACTKLIVAANVGDRGFALRVVPSIVVPLVAAWTAGIALGGR